MTVGVAVDEWLASGGLARALAWREPPAAGTLSTPITPEFVAWRFGSTLQPCRAVEDDRAAVIVERRRRGQVTELVCMLAFGSPRAVDRLLRRTMRAAGADLAIRLGTAAPQRGFLPLFGLGPRLTCRMLHPAPAPPLSEWALSLGDVVLF
jgi:hypothetical protein